MVVAGRHASVAPSWAARPRRRSIAVPIRRSRPWWALRVPWLVVLLAGTWLWIHRLELVVVVLTGAFVVSVGEVGLILLHRA